MIGMFGTFNKTPHGTTLAWMKDSLDLWAEAQWGWALWHFIGKAGILQSKRSDVDYQTFKVHEPNG